MADSGNDAIMACELLRHKVEAEKATDRTGMISGKSGVN
jgi:hypothetical protein